MSIFYDGFDIRDLDKNGEYTYPDRNMCPYYQYYLKQFRCPFMQETNEYNRQLDQPGMPGSSQEVQIPPPPKAIPPKPQSAGPQVTAVDPGAVKPCTNRYIYIWLTNGQSFWAYLTFAGETSVAGYMWTRTGWKYFGIDTNKIDTFVCY
ncbi:MAG: hypothetical protein E7211_02220 [Clostridium lundense]|nr:hypothetical protein [Clostridium lundense]